LQGWKPTHLNRVSHCLPPLNHPKVLHPGSHCDYRVIPEQHDVSHGVCQRKQGRLSARVVLEVEPNEDGQCGVMHHEEGRNMDFRLPQHEHNRLEHEKVFEEEERVAQIDDLGSRSSQGRNDVNNLAKLISHLQCFFRARSIKWLPPPVVLGQPQPAELKREEAVHNGHDEVDSCRDELEFQRFSRHHRRLEDELNQDDVKCRNSDDTKGRTHEELPRHPRVGGLVKQEIPCRREIHVRLIPAKCYTRLTEAPAQLNLVHLIRSLKLTIRYNCSLLHNN
jgi:hypothetical protein